MNLPAPADDPHPAQWYTTNLVGVPAPVLASTLFQAHPVPLAIAGVRAAHRNLFTLLERAADAAEAREVFSHYMTLAFDLQRDPDAATTHAPRRYRAGYPRLLLGWGLDASCAAGAVFKGWVESRFGLVPWFHKEPLARFPSPAWITYLEEKASPGWNNNNIHQQLDLVYEFGQWLLEHHRPLPHADDHHVVLWRGSNQMEEQVVAGSLRQRHCTVRLNNAVSFAIDRDQAECFGDRVFQARVPLCKLVVFPGLLPGSLLRGEGEVIALGGDYDVEVSRHA